MSLTALGVVSYNGYVFSENVQTKLKVEAVTNRADNTVKYRKATLTISDTCVLPAGSTNVNATFTALRLLITCPGKTLVYSGRGYDSINTSTTPDVKAGPIPRLLNFSVVGADQTVYFAVEYTVCLPPCEDSDHTGILALEYKVIFEQDANLVRKWSFEGYVEYAQTRNGSTLTQRYTDTELSSLFPLPDGNKVKRENIKLELDESRSIITFAFVDKETWAPYPNGIAIASGEYTVESNQASTESWVVKLRANYVIPQGGRKSDGIKAFRALVTSKLLAIASDRRPANYTQVVMTEDPYGNTVSFGIQWLLTTPLYLIVRHSNFGESPPTGDSSVPERSYPSVDEVYQPTAGLAAFDKIVGRCETATSGSGNGTFATVDPLTGNLEYVAPSLRSPQVVRSSMTCSSVRYTGTEQYRRYSGEPSAAQSPGSSSGAYVYDAASQEGDAAFHATPPTYRTTVSGLMVTLGVPLAEPVLESIGGQTPMPTEVPDICERSVLTDWGGNPMHVMRFRQTRAAGSVPKAAPVVLNIGGLRVDPNYWHPISNRSSPAALPPFQAAFASSSQDTPWAPSNLKESDQAAAFFRAATSGGFTGTQISGYYGTGTAVPSDTQSGVDQVNGGQ